MLIEPNLQDFLIHENSQFKQLQKRRKLEISAVFIIVSLFQMAAVMFTIGVGQQHSIYKAIGFGIISLALAISAIMIKKMEQTRIDDVDSEEYELKTSMTIMFIQLIFFFVTCLANVLGADYHFILCGNVTFGLFITLFMTIFKHKTLRFPVRSFMVHQSIFWFLYYFLNVSWNRNIHWGFNIYFGVLAIFSFTAIFTCNSVNLYFTMFIFYFIFIYYYFVTASIILNWSDSPPWQQLSVMVHTMYIFNVAACIHSWRAIFIPEGMAKLSQVSENIFKISDNGLGQDQNQQLNDHHLCRICIDNGNSACFGFKCADVFFHISICKMCVLDHCDRFKGNCLICGTHHRYLYFIEKHRKFWIASHKFDLSQIN